MAKASVENVIRRGWETYKNNWLSIILAVLIIYVIEGVLFVIGIMPLLVTFISMAASGMSGTEMLTALMTQWQSLIISLAFMAIFLTMAVLVGMALRGGLVGMLIQALKKKKISYSSFWPVTRARWKSFMGAGIIATAIGLGIFGAVLIPAFFILLTGESVAGLIAIAISTLILLPVALIIGVFFAFVYIAIAADKKVGAIDGIKTSVRFALKNFWATLGIMVIFMTISILASFLDMVTYVLGSLLIYFVIIPLELLSLAALYLGRKKGRR